jgi:hypothetical protein
MTLVNFAIERERAIVAADSVASMPDGSTGRYVDGTAVFHHKLHVFAGFVLSGLGSIALWRRMLEAAPSYADADAAMARLPDILRHAWPACPPPGYLYSGNSVAVLVGWSDHRQRMVGVQFDASKEFAPQIAEVDGPNQSAWVLNPGPHAPPGYLRDADAAGMLRIAQWQCEHWRAKCQDVPIGGRLSVCELTRDAITLRIVGDLGLSPRAVQSPKEEACT